VPHFYPIVIPAGRSIAGDSLGFHAYSLRIDNLTNQWLLEETSLAWIPPYSLGVCLRLYGTGVAILLNQAPVGQPQLPPVSGESSIGVYSDQLRTEVAGTGVRQFTLVQAVSDLTMGPEPALPPVGVDRLWADTSGLIHHLHSNGVDTILVDPLQTGVVTSGMILDGTIAAADLAAGAAAGNVGALGGVLTGTLPNPGLAAGAASGSVGALGGALTGILPAPALVWNQTPGNRINGVPASTPTTVITLGVVQGLLFVWATVMAQNTGAFNDNYVWQIQDQVGTMRASIYGTYITGGLWGSSALGPYMINNTSGAITSLTLKLTSNSTPLNIAGDFSSLGYLKLA
jgi:hypothetical protein